MENTTYYLIILALVVLSFLVVYWWRSRAYRVPNPVESEGEVVDIETISLPGINPWKLIQGKSDKSVRHHPIVRFKLDQERRVRFRNRKGYKNRDKYPVGQEVRIVYSQDNPLLAMIKE